MNQFADNESFIHEIFRAQLALFRHHLLQRDNEEMQDDLQRALRISEVLALRYPNAHCQAQYEWFLEGVRAS